MKKTALITGATGPLGTEITRALAKADYNVIVNYRSDKKKAEKLGRETEGKIIRADVTEPKEVAKLIKAAGKIDVLVNAVGDFIYKPLSETSKDDFEKCIASNLFSAWYCINEVLPKMRRQKFGRIINFGSAGCDRLTARPFTTPYYIAKSGLLMLTRTLARENKNNGITINMIAPGVLPHGVHPAGAPIISYQDIVNGILYFLSPAAKTLTGSYLEISRGWRPE